MELKDFIKNTIMDIAKAIEEANNEANDRVANNSVDVQINPYPLYKNGEEYQTYRSNGNSENKQVEMIDFDVAVTSSSSASGNVGGGINVAGFELGGKGEVNDGNENVSRIKFQIPVRLPFNET